MIEPAALGVPTSFGPNTSNFRDVVDQLMARNAATIVRDVRELALFINSSLAPENDFQGDRLRQIVFANQGATDRTLSALETVLSERLDSAVKAA